MSLKQAAKLRLPAPASTEAARRELVMHLLARRKLQFVPTRDHPDGVLVETAHDVLSDDDLSCMRDVLASCALGCCSAQKNSSALDTLVAEFQVQEEQHARSAERLHRLRLECLMRARTEGRGDVIAALS